MSGELTFLGLAELREAEDNPRVIKDDRFDALVYALEKSPGMLEARPVIMDARPGRGDVVAGNMRSRAAAAALEKWPDGDLAEALEAWGGMPTYLKHFRDDNERREWQFRDNTEYGEYVPDEVAALLRAHRDEGGDLLLLGMSTTEQDAYLLSDESDPLPGDDRDADDVKIRVPERVSRGDLWLLGDHRLVCGDAGDAETLYRLTDTELEVGFVLTDPPYGMDLDTDFSSMKSKISEATGGTFEPVIGDDAPFDAGPVALFFDAVERQAWFGADYYVRTLPWEAPASWAVWDKRTEDTDAGFGSGFELVALRHGAKREILRWLWFGFMAEKGSTDEARNRVHPTQKPVGLLAEMLKKWAPKDGAVVDPYAGSGSTVIACEQEGRTCYAVELDPRYCDVIVARWEAWTGLKATRGGSA